MSRTLVNCVNVALPEFKALVNELNINSAALENIVYEYQHIKGNESSFPSRAYIESKIYGTPDIVDSDAFIRAWEKLYSEPILTNSIQEAEAIKANIKIFKPESISIKHTKDGQYEVRVAKPVLGNREVFTANQNNIEELNSIREQAIKDGRIILKEDGSFDYALAPNGKRSNLNEKQWLQVRTKEFKEWFGDWTKITFNNDGSLNIPEGVSYIVDENGEPLVVYHGSNYELDATKQGDWSKNVLPYATYFATYKYTGGNLNYYYSAFLNIKNPIYEHYDLTEDAIQDEDTFNKLIKENGFDGAITGNNGISKAIDAKEIVVINPNQIKSATDNNGEFSREDDNIYYKTFGNEAEYQEFIDEYNLNREKADLFLVNFMTKVLMINPKNKLDKTIPITAQNFPYSAKTFIPFNKENSILYKILGTTSLDFSLNSEKLEEYLKDYLDNKWEKDLYLEFDKIEKYYSNKLNTNYKELNQLKEKILLLKSYLANPKLASEESKALVDSLLQNKRDYTSVKQHIGYELSKLYKEVEDKNNTIQHLYFSKASNILKVKNRLLALNSIEGIKDLIYTRVIAERDSYKLPNSTWEEKIKPYLPLYELVSKATASTQLNKENSAIFSKFSETKDELGNTAKELSIKDIVKILEEKFPDKKELLHFIKITNPKVKIYIYSNDTYNKAFNESPFKKSAGMYQPRLNTLRLNEESSLDTILHECIHAISSYGLVVTHKSEESLGTTVIQPFIDYIIQYLSKNIGDFGPVTIMGYKFDASVYGLTNPAEFMAELFSNEAFRELLDSIPPMEKTKYNTLLENIIHKVLEFLNNILGLNQKETALTQATKLALGVIRTQYVAKNEIYKQLESFKTNNKLTEAQNRYISNVPTADTKINIYAGTGENADLSNFAVRPFKIEAIKLDGTIGTVRFNSVEQAFQYIKATAYSNKGETVDIDTAKAILNATSSADIKRLGKKVKNLDVREWDNNSSDIMKDLLRASFKQNPQALQRLLSTGNATLTHTQDKSKWGTEFPRLLMEVREELAKNTSNPTVETHKGYWTREEVKNNPDKVYLFGDNTDDRVNTHHIPTSTQAVIRGLDNAIGIDTKKNRGTSPSSYFTDADFDTFKAQVDDAINKALATGKTIELPEDGIGTGKAMLKEKAPKLFNYLQQELNKLSDRISQSLGQESTTNTEESPNPVTPDLQEFQDKTASVVNQISTLLDMPNMTSTEVRDLSNKVAYFMSDIITELLSNPENIFVVFPSLGAKEGKDLTPEEKAAKIAEIREMNRAKLVEFITPERLIALTAARLFNPTVNKNINTPLLNRKAQKLKNNIEGLVWLGSTTFSALEGFGIITTGKKMEVAQDMNPSVDDFNNNQDPNSIIENEGSLQENWQVEFRTRDIISSMSAKIRQRLGSLYQLKYNADTETYERVESAWGAERIPAQVAIKSMLRWTKGATTLKEMTVKLQEKVKENPWVSQVVTLLNNEEGEESDFQSEFFGVMRKPFQSYSIVIEEKGKDGSKTLKTVNVNENPALRQERKNIEVLYRTNNHPLFIGEKINKDTLETFTTIVDKLLELRVKPLEQNDKNEVVTYLTRAADCLGYTTDEATMDTILDSNAVFTSMVDALMYISRSLNAAINKANYDPFNFKDDLNILGNLSTFLKPLTARLEDTAISSFYDNGKMYQSYVSPSYLTTFMDYMTSEDTKFQQYLKEEFGKYEWFTEKDGSYRLGWLEELSRLPQEERKKLFKHKVQLSFNKHNYMKNMTEAEYTLSILAEYFSEKVKANETKVPAWFKIPMMSNKPSSEFIRMYKYTGSVDRVSFILADKLVKVFFQELSRIQTVEVRNYDETNPNFIQSFDTNGRTFMFLNFFNEYLPSNTEGIKSNTLSQEDAKAFKTLIEKALKEGTATLNPEEINNLNNFAKTVITKTINNRANSIVSQWKSNGVFEGAKKINNIEKNNEALENELKCFIWNDFYASINILQLTVTDLAYYKDAEDLQKRLAQIHAPGTKPNKDATDYEGEKVSDGKFRTVLLKDFKTFKSNIIENLKVVFTKKLKDLEDTGVTRESAEYKAAKATYDGIIKSFEEINVADAQGYSSPTSYRKKALLFGKWSREAENLYQKILSGNYSYTDIKQAFQPLKPFVYGQISRPGIDAANKDIPISMSKLKVPVQFKNSEYLLIMADAILKGENTGKPNLLRAVYEVMEESARVNPTRGIDTIQFESTCKSGLQAVIDINQYYNDKNGELKAKRALEEAIYKIETIKDDDGTERELLSNEYNTENYVYEVPFENYSIQQEIPAHFKDHYQAHGSQGRYIIPSDLEVYNSYGEEVRYKFTDKGEEKSVTAEEFKAEYEATISENIEESLRELAEELGIYNNFVSKKDRNIALSKILMKEIQSSPRYGADLLIACSVNPETGEFNIPLGDPIQSKRVEQLINSLVKNRINKQEIAGGPLVQVSNFGTSKELNIRFKDKQGNLLQTRAEFEGTDQEFKNYLRENQAGIAYYEVYASIYTNDLFRQFADEKGNIDIAAIEKVNPDLLKLIGYRIPTEDKYSMAPLKIVGFLPREAGDGIMLPNDITLLTGSDFDIDKFYVMRKDYNIKRVKGDNKLQEELIESVLQRGLASSRYKAKSLVYDFMANPTASTADPILKEIYLTKGITVESPAEGSIYRNNKIIDMTWAVLTEETTASKMLTPGGFDPEKKLGYIVTVLQDPNNKYSWEQLQNMSIKEIKKKAYTDKNLCFIDTHLNFYRQNSAAATALGMAAVQKIAHAVLEGDGFSIDIDGLLELDGDTFTLGDTTFGGRMELDSKYDSEGNLIGRTLGEFVAMFADAVKDPVANLMNINNTTMPIITAMIRMKVPFTDSALFLSQPIIKEVISLFNKENLTNFVPLQEFIIERYNTLSKELNSTSDSVLGNLNTISREEMISNLAPEKRDPITDLKVLDFLLKFLDVSSAIKGPTYATRFNSISNAVGPLIIDNLIMQYKIDEANFDYFYDRDGASASFEDILIAHPILNSFYKTVDLAQNLFAEFPTNSGNFREKVLGRMNEDLRGLFFKNRKLLSELSDFYLSYLLIANGTIPVEATEDNQAQGIDYYINKFPNIFIRKGFKDKYKGNPLIDAIRLDTNGDIPILKINVTGMEISDKERLGDGWVDLYNSGEEGKKLAMHLFYYNFFRGGIGFNPTTFMALLPIQLRSKIPGYSQTYKTDSNNFAENVSGDLVVDQFIRNNWGDNKLVPRIMYGKDGLTATIKGNTFTFENENAIGIMDLSYIKTKINGQDVLLRRTYKNTKERVVSFVKIAPLGNNGTYLEMSTTLKDTALNSTKEATAQSKETQVTSNLSQEEDTMSRQSSQPTISEKKELARAAKIRNKLLEMFMIKGRTKEEAAAKIEEFKAKSMEEKMAYKPAMKKFIANRFSQMDIKFDDKLLEEMFNELC